MKRFGVLSAALLAACGGSSTPSVNAPPLTTFTYSAPQTATATQQSTATTASTDVGQIVVSTSPSNPAGASSAPTLAESLGVSVLEATAQRSPNSPAAEAAARLAQKTRSGEITANCYSVTGDTLTYNNCSYSYNGVSETANGTLTATASTVTWNLTFTVSVTDTSGNFSVQYVSTGNISYTATSISGSCVSQYSGTGNYNGQSESFAFTVGIDFLNITISATCDGGGGIVSGTLEVRANATGSANYLGFTQKGVEYIWSGCDTVSVATSN
jgi:hypothetical protein